KNVFREPAISLRPINDLAFVIHACLGATHRQFHRPRQPQVAPAAFDPPYHPYAYCALDCQELGHVHGGQATLGRDDEKFYSVRVTHRAGGDLGARAAGPYCISGRLGGCACAGDQGVDSLLERGGITGGRESLFCRRSHSDCWPSRGGLGSLHLCDQASRDRSWPSVTSLYGSCNRVSEQFAVYECLD